MFFFFRESGGLLKYRRHITGVFLALRERHLTLQTTHGGLTGQPHDTEPSYHTEPTTAPAALN